MKGRTVIDLDRNSTDHVVQSLAQLLADTYITALKTQNFHWNVVDSRFIMLHELFEKFYNELAEAIDDLAERIRKLNQKSPGSMREFLELSTLDEAETDLSGDEMIHDLCRDRDTIIQHIRHKIEEASKAGDEGTADLLIQQLRMHEKAAWVLRSHLFDDTV